MFRQALAIFEKSLGPEDPLVAVAVENIGLLYFAQRRYSEAEPLILRSIDLHEKILGADHPDTANSVTSLGVLYLEVGAP